MVADRFVFDQDILLSEVFGNGHIQSFPPENSKGPWAYTWDSSQFWFHLHQLDKHCIKVTFGKYGDELATERRYGRLSTECHDQIVNINRVLESLFAKWTAAWYNETVVREWPS